MVGNSNRLLRLHSESQPGSCCCRIPGIPRSRRRRRSLLPFPGRVYSRRSRCPAADRLPSSGISSCSRRRWDATGSPSFGCMAHYGNSSPYHNHMRAGSCSCHIPGIPHSEHRRRSRPPFPDRAMCWGSQGSRHRSLCQLDLQMNIFCRSSDFRHRGDLLDNQHFGSIGHPQQLLQWKRWKIVSISTLHIFAFSKIYIKRSAKVGAPGLVNFFLLLLLITSAPACLQHSRNLEHLL